MDPDQKNERLEIIEALRFFAAAAVVCAHIPPIGIGIFGVDLFFIISGFVMMYSTEVYHDNFFKRRLIRILPTYYFFTIGVFIIAGIAPSLLTNTTANIEHLLKSLLFIPFDKNGSGHFPVLFLGWTLNYEMYFYFLFAISLMISQKFRGMVVSVLMILVFLMAMSASSLPISAYGDLIIFEFILGVLAFTILKQLWMQSALIFGFSALTIALNFEGAHRFFFFGLPCFLVFYACVRYLANVRVTPILVTLGGSSYALYLSHPYVIKALQSLRIVEFASPVTGIISTAVILIVTNLLALLIYHRLEMPIGKWLRAQFIKNR